MILSFLGPADQRSALCRHKGVAMLRGLLKAGQSRTAGVGVWLVPAVLALALAASEAVSAQPLDYGLQEQIFRVSGELPGTLPLEVTVFKPSAPGPFPLVVINHGRAAGSPRSQPRYRPLHAAYEFVRRGYAVVVPMREGFAASGGVEPEDSCDVAANARQQARSVRTAAQWASEQPWADATRLVVMGPSHGGLATLAYGESPLQGTQLLVNVSGGLRLAGCADWQNDLVEAMASFGRAERAIHSLWIYGENDSHFSSAVWRTAHQRYVALGGKAELHSVGRFGDDAHLLFASREGVPHWLPLMIQQMAAHGLPTEIQTRFDALLDLPDARLQRKALAAEADRTVAFGASARRAYLQWLDALSPKAFAISENGRHWSAAWGLAKPSGKALEQCEREANSRCRLFAVDGYLVSSDP